MSVTCFQYRRGGSDISEHSHEHAPDNRFVLSGHAVKRAQQRGVRPRTIRLVLGHYDQCLHAGGGLHAVRISKRHASHLSRHGISSSWIDRARGVVLIVSLSDRTIVTVMHEFQRRWRK